VYCLSRKGDTEGAWHALTPDGDPVPPRDRNEASIWIALTAKCDTSQHFVSRALATMRRWPDDEELLGIFIAQIYSGLHRDELTPGQSDLDALHKRPKNMSNSSRIAPCSVHTLLVPRMILSQPSPTN
jgi:hypothetical protein